MSLGKEEVFPRWRDVRVDFDLSGSPCISGTSRGFCETNPSIMRRGVGPVTRWQRERQPLCLARLPPDFAI